MAERAKILWNCVKIAWNYMKECIKLRETQNTASPCWPGSKDTSNSQNRLNMAEKSAWTDKHTHRQKHTQMLAFYISGFHPFIEVSKLNIPPLTCTNIYNDNICSHHGDSDYVTFSHQNCRHVCFTSAIWRHLLMLLVLFYIKLSVAVTHPRLMCLW